MRMSMTRSMASSLAITIEDIAGILRSCSKETLAKAQRAPSLLFAVLQLLIHLRDEALGGGIGIGHSCIVLSRGLRGNHVLQTLALSDHRRDLVANGQHDVAVRHNSIAINNV